MSSSAPFFATHNSNIPQRLRDGFCQWAVASIQYLKSNLPLLRYPFQRCPSLFNPPVASIQVVSSGDEFQVGSDSSAKSLPRRRLSGLYLLYLPQHPGIFLPLLDEALSMPVSVSPIFRQYVLVPNTSSKQLPTSRRNRCTCHVAPDSLCPLAGNICCSSAIVSDLLGAYFTFVPFPRLRFIFIPGYLFLNVFATSSLNLGAPSLCLICSSLVQSTGRDLGIS